MEKWARSDKLEGETVDESFFSPPPPLKFPRIYLWTCLVHYFSLHEQQRQSRNLLIQFADEYKVVRHWSIDVKETEQNFLILPECREVDSGE